MSNGKILGAAVYASQMHASQRRKGSSQAPYVNHVLMVAHAVAEAGADDDVIIAALLHDVVEDTDATEADLRQRFGDRVTDFVMEVTDDKTLPKAERKRLQIANAGHKSTGAKMIKLADKTSNVADLEIDPPKDWSTERIIEYFDWAKQVVDGLRGEHPEMEAKFDAVYDLGIAQFS